MFFKKDSGGVSWLLVCLGNPGDKYENTRHNIGFQVLDQLGERQKKPIQRLKFKALTNLFTISGEKVLVMKPVTYMNLSGEAVRQAADFYKIPPDRVLVVSDDTALPVGRLRIRGEGLRRGAQRAEKHHPAPGYRPVPPPAGGGGREAPPRLRYGRLGAGKIRWRGQKGHRRRRQTGRRRH